MTQLEHFFLLVEAYCSATGAAEATLSGKIFSDGKRIAAIRNGSDVGVRRMAIAICWFSEHWPEGAEWPACVPRPILSVAEAAE
jgi:hypothetical protein